MVPRMEAMGAIKATLKMFLGCEYWKWLHLQIFPLGIPPITRQPEVIRDREAQTVKQAG